MPAVFGVNTTQDTVAANRKTNTDAQGRGSLRSASSTADARSGTDTIPSPNGTRRLTIAGACGTPPRKATWTSSTCSPDDALGGADTITVNDLTGTDLTQVNLDLASPPGSGAGDGQADNVIINGTNGDDAITVGGDANGVAVVGLSAQVNIAGAEAANDRLTINTLGGDDVMERLGPVERRDRPHGQWR